MDSDFTLIAAVTMLALAGLILAPHIMEGVVRPMMARQRLESSAAGEVAAGRGPSPSALGDVVVALGTRFAGGNQAQLKGDRLRLIRAGYFDPNAIFWYYGLRVVVLAAGAVFSLLLFFSMGDATVAARMMNIAAIMGIAFIAPSFILDSRLKEQQRDYEIGFANVMDLLVVCVEAGMGVEAGLQRICDEIQSASPKLKRNLEILLLELRAGRDRAAAFSSLGERLGIESAMSFGRVLVQSEELGASIAQTLRVSASELRQKRMFRAEEYAYSLPVRIVVPLGLFIFPAMLVVVTLPVFIGVSKTLFAG